MDTSVDLFCSPKTWNILLTSVSGIWILMPMSHLWHNLKQMSLSHKQMLLKQHWRAWETSGKSDIEKLLASSWEIFISGKRVILGSRWEKRSRLALTPHWNENRLDKILDQTSTLWKHGDFCVLLKKSRQTYAKFREEYKMFYIRWHMKLDSLSTHSLYIHFNFISKRAFALFFSNSQPLPSY